jgi:hypothetical protein
VFKFTSHAIERYIERVEPGLNYRKAVKKLPELAERATAKKQKTGSGQQQWIVDEPRCAFITKIVDDRRSQRKINLVVTVLGEAEMAVWEAENQDPYAFEKELYEEYQATLAERKAKAEESKKQLQRDIAEAKRIKEAKGFPGYKANGAFKAQKETKLNGKDWMQLIDRIAKENKAICRYESHRENIKGSLDNKADALRIALQTLTELAEHGGTMAQDAVDRIRAIDPKFLKSNFMWNVTQENKRIVKRE